MVSCSHYVCCSNVVYYLRVNCWIIFGDISVLHLKQFITVADLISCIDDNLPQSDTKLVITRIQTVQVFFVLFFKNVIYFEAVP